MSSYTKVATTAQNSVLNGVTDVVEAQAEALGAVREAVAGVLRSAAELPTLPSLVESTFSFAKDMQDLQKQSLLAWANFIAPSKPAARAARAA